MMPFPFPLFYWSDDQRCDGRVAVVVQLNLIEVDSATMVVLRRKQRSRRLLHLIFIFSDKKLLLRRGLV